VGRRAVLEPVAKRKIPNIHIESPLQFLQLQSNRVHSSELNDFNETRYTQFVGGFSFDGLINLPTYCLLTS